MLDYNLIWDNLPLYLNGVLLTLKVLLISLACGLLLAIPLGRAARGASPDRGPRRSSPSPRPR